jgi:hypothetical protein
MDRGRTDRPLHLIFPILCILSATVIIWRLVRHMRERDEDNDGNQGEADVPASRVLPQHDGVDVRHSTFLKLSVYVWKVWLVHWPTTRRIHARPFGAVAAY